MFDLPPPGRGIDSELFDSKGSKLC